MLDCCNFLCRQTACVLVMEHADTIEPHRKVQYALLAKLVQRA
jgi:hypothetical protein